MGTSPDWDSERFTLDDGLSKAVRDVFVQLYREGLIYRGKRLVNWDPVLHTALSDLEVINQEEQGHLWHIRYPRSDGKGHVVVATTRPETLLGDAAVAVHPDDERYRDLIGKTLQLPLSDREIPVIADDYVDPEFGSGCVKITPAHDFNDWDVGQRHDLPVRHIVNHDAPLNTSVAERFAGLDRFEARQRIVAELEQLGLLERTETHQHAIPRGDRSGAVLEPLLTDQWFVSMQSLAEPAIEAVQDGRIRFVPENWNKTYFEWLNNIQDWCISRQLWWGHRIPAWYDNAGNIYVGDDEQAVRTAHDLPAELELRQDEDVLDTWFSSALWPFSTLGWPEQSERLQTFYPTSVLVTGFDIIFFWVARMIMLGLKFTGEVPFREVYVHGLIRDAHGQKMSKSKGNVLDPLQLIDGIELDELLRQRTRALMQPQMKAAIEKATRAEFPDGIPAFGTDALRFTLASLATQGRDMSLDLSRIQGYRNFCNKLWNASRFALLQLEGRELQPDAWQQAQHPVNRWIIARLQHSVSEVRRHFDGYRFDLATQTLYEFTWSEFCDWYLELSKLLLSEEHRNAHGDETLSTLMHVLDQLLCLLHPLIPFITEDIWQRLREPLALTEISISVRAFPQAEQAKDASAVADIEWLQAVIMAIRSTRTELNLAPGKPMPLLVYADATAQQRVQQFLPWLQRLARVGTIEWLDQAEVDQECASAQAGDMQMFIPLAGLIDVEAELARLDKQLQKAEREQQALQAKLANDQFIHNAPAQVVAAEREKFAAKTTSLEQLREQQQAMLRLR
jgi:valyl-tRNA synthetase